MDNLSATLEYDKSTKNKFRYREPTDDGQAPTVETIYLPKWLTGQDPPEEIEVAVSEA